METLPPLGLRTGFNEGDDESTEADKPKKVRHRLATVRLPCLTPADWGAVPMSSGRDDL
jgi:hypothetical protein